MKKLLWLIVLALLLGRAEAGLRKLKQGQDTSIEIHLVNASTGAGITGATPGSVTAFVKKQSDSGSTTTTAVVMTTAGGSTTDLREMTLGAYNLEIPASLLDVIGSWTLCYSYSAAVTSCDTYEVSAASDPQFSGDYAHVSDVLAELCTTEILVAGSWGKKLCDNLDASISTRLAPTVAGRTLNVHTTGVAEVAGQIETGTAQAGASASITLAATANGTNNYYTHKRIVLMSGTGAGQSGIVTAYNGSSKVATISCEGSTTGVWFTNPSTDTGYVILPRNR